MLGDGLSDRERAAQTWAEQSYRDSEAQVRSATTGFLAGIAYAERYQQAQEAPSEPSPVIGTAFVNVQIADASLGAISEEIETAVLDGVRRAFAKIELAADR